jgi:hypothetical protein
MGYKSQLLMMIMAKDQSKKELVGVSRNIQKTGRVGAKAGRQVASSWAMAGKAIGAAGVAFGLKQLNEMAKAGRASLAVDDAFKRLNKSAGDLIVTMRKASGGLLDDTNLQKIANKLQAIELSGAQMGSVLEAAMKLAAGSGQNYLDVTQRLTQALITGETESFKTLGILVDSKQALQAYADQNGRTVESLDKTEQAQAKVNEALRQTNKRFGDVDTSGFVDEAEQAATMAANFEDKLNRVAFLGKTGFVQGVNVAADAVILWGDALEDLLGVSNKEKEARQAQNKALDEYARKAGDAARATALETQHARALLVALGGVKNIMPALIQSTSNLGGVALATAASFREAVIQARALADIDKLGKDVADHEKFVKLLEEEQRLTDIAGAKQTSLDKKRLGLVSAQIIELEKSLPDAQEVYLEFLDGVVAKDKQTREEWLAATKANIAATVDAVKKATTGDGNGPAAPQRVDQTPALEAARRGAELELFVTQNFITEKERMLAEFREREKVIAAEEFTDAERRVALETLDLERKKFLLEEEARATEEAKRRQAQAEQMLADTRRANQQRMEKETARRAAAEAKATATTRRNVQGSINASNQLAHAFIENKKALNVVDGLTEAARSIAAFARYDFFAGAQHAIASAAFFKAAATSTKASAGGTGGAFATSNPDTANRFDGATTPDQGQGGNVTINVHGFAGDEEKLSQEVVRLANIGGQSGFKINGDAVDESRREGF